MLRCSFCAAAWELTTYACVYCGEDGEPFVTAAPDEERKDRRVEVCSSCGGYLKTVDTAALSPFPLLSIGDLETMDLDMAAMEHGYAKPPMKEFRSRSCSGVEAADLDRSNPPTHSSPIARGACRTPARCPCAGCCRAHPW